MSADALNDQYGRMPMQSDGSTLAWGVNSFARLPVHGGAFSEDVAQTAGHSMPCVRSLKTSLYSGLWAAVVDYNPAVSAPMVPRRAPRSPWLRKEKRSAGAA